MVNYQDVFGRFFCSPTPRINCHTLIALTCVIFVPYSRKQQITPVQCFESVKLCGGKKWSGGQEKHTILLALRRFEISFHILSSNMISVPPVKGEIGKSTIGNYMHSQKIRLQLKNNSHFYIYFLILFISSKLVLSIMDI